MRHQLLLVIASVFVLWLAPAQAQDTRTDEEAMFFDDIPSVFGASKYEQKTTEAPSAVSIITANEIKKYGYRTLADVLRSVRSFYVTNDRNYSYVGVRGFSRPGDYSTRVLLLVDGFRTNDSLYDSGSYGTAGIIDVDLIERVEIIRGPSSSLYGNNAFFGVINVITKRGRDIQGGEVAVEGGSFDTYQGRVSYGNKLGNGLEMLLSASHYESKGQERLYYPEFDAPATNNGVAEDSDGDEARRFFAKLAYKDFSINAVFSEREKLIPTAPWGTIFNDPRTKTLDQTVYVDAKYEHMLANQSVFMARLYYGEYQYDGEYIYDYPPVTLFVDDDDGKWWGSEVQLTKLIGEKHKVIIGADYQDNYQLDQKAFDEDPFFLYLDNERDSSRWAVYLQDEWRLHDKLIVNLGLRHDDYSTFGGTTNPRAALIYNPVEPTTFKLLYGEAFRAPNSYELYYEDGGTSQAANPNLEPETIKTYELVMEQKFNRQLRGMVSYFDYTTENLITQQVDGGSGLLIFNNVDKVQACGYELELEGKLSNQIDGRISYTYQESHDTSNDQELSNSPKHLTKLNLTAPLISEKLFAGLEVQHTSKRKTVLAGDAEAYTVTNLTLFNQNWIKSLEISASVYNLFDEEYGDPGGEEHIQNTIEQDGRHYRLKVQYEF